MEGCPKEWKTGWLCLVDSVWLVMFGRLCLIIFVYRWLLSYLVVWFMFGLVCLFKVGLFLFILVFGGFIFRFLGPIPLWKGSGFLGAPRFKGPQPPGPKPAFDLSKFVHRYQKMAGFLNMYISPASNLASSAACFRGVSLHPPNPSPRNPLVDRQTFSLPTISRRSEAPPKLSEVPFWTAGEW